MSWGSSAAEDDARALAAGLISPRAGIGVCPRCFDLTPGGHGECRSCRQNEHHLSAVLPVSYSIGGERLHHELEAYKRLADRSVPAALTRVSELLERALSAHERCLATAAGVDGFDLVTTVPSGHGAVVRDEHHPLRAIVASSVAVGSRHQRLLVRGSSDPPGRTFARDRFCATRELDGANLLLIDDMWTTGASAESAAAALRQAGAKTVAALVLGRHLNRAWAGNDLRLRWLAGNFSWEDCPLCATVEAFKAA